MATELEVLHNFEDFVDDVMRPMNAACTAAEEEKTAIESLAEGLAAIKEEYERLMPRYAAPDYQDVYEKLTELADETEERAAMAAENYAEKCDEYWGVYRTQFGRKERAQ